MFCLVYITIEFTYKIGRFIMNTVNSAPSVKLYSSTASKCFHDRTFCIPKAISSLSVFAHPRHCRNIKVHSSSVLTYSRPVQPVFWRHVLPVDLPVRHTLIQKQTGPIETQGYELRVCPNPPALRFVRTQSYTRNVFIPLSQWLILWIHSRMMPTMTRVWYLTVADAPHKYHCRTTTTAPNTPTNFVLGKDFGARRGEESLLWTRNDGVHWKICV